MSFPQIEVKKTYLRATHGTISTGSESKGNYKNLGHFFEGRLSGKIKAKPAKDNFKAHWEIHLKSDDGNFILNMPMGTQKAANFFNTLASVHHLEKPLKLNVWLGKPFKEGATPPTNISIRVGDWDDYKNNYRWKYPYLKTDQQPLEGCLYFPYPETFPDGKGGFLKDDNDKIVKKWNRVNKFIQENIVNMINEKLKGIAEERQIANQFNNTSQDDLPNTLSSAPNTQHTQHKQQAPPPTVTDTLFDEDDDLPF